MNLRALLPWAIAAALLVALVLTCGDESPEPILSEETTAEIERLRADSAETHGKLDSLAELARASRDTARLREEAADRARQRADQRRRDADAARTAVARAENYSDSLALMQVAYEERTEEAAELRQENDTLRSALLLANRAAELSSERAALAESRVQALEELQGRILADVAEAQKGCRILKLVRCPTRKESAVLGAVGGALAAFALK
jgi:chromosome segregation ATPase